MKAFFFKLGHQTTSTDLIVFKRHVIYTFTNSRPRLKAQNRQVFQV